MWLFVNNNSLAITIYGCHPPFLRFIFLSLKARTWRRICDTYQLLIVNYFRPLWIVDENNISWHYLLSLKLYLWSVSVLFVHIGYYSKVYPWSLSVIARKRIFDRYQLYIRDMFVSLSVVTRNYVYCPCGLLLLNTFLSTSVVTGRCICDIY